MFPPKRPDTPSCGNIFKELKSYIRNSRFIIMLYSFLGVKLVSFNGKMKPQCSAVCVANMFWFLPCLSGMASDPQKKERLSTLWCIALATSKPGPLQVNKSTLIHTTLQLKWELVVASAELWINTSVCIYSSNSFLVSYDKRLFFLSSSCSNTVQRKHYIFSGLWQLEWCCAVSFGWWVSQRTVGCLQYEQACVS